MVWRRSNGIPSPLIDDLGMRKLPLTAAEELLKVPPIPSVLAPCRYWAGFGETKASLGVK